MGTNAGGNYSGTSGGSNAGSGPHAKAMYSHLKNWATTKATELEKQSKRQRDKFTTATVVYDESTGKYYYGINKGIKKSGEPKNPILFGDDSHKGILPAKSMNQYEVGNCAEVHAINHALNNGAKLKNLHISTIHTTVGSMGKSKEACENCTYAFKGKIKHNNTGWHKGGKH